MRLHGCRDSTRLREYLLLSSCFNIPVSLLQCLRCFALLARLESGDSSANTSSSVFSLSLAFGVASAARALRFETRACGLPSSSSSSFVYAHTPRRFETRPVSHSSCGEPKRSRQSPYSSNREEERYFRLMSGLLLYDHEGSHISIVLRETRAEPRNGDRHGHVTDRQGGDIFFSLSCSGLRL